MASTIIIKNGTSGTPSSLVQGELAIDVSTGKLFHGTTGGTAVSSSFTFTEVTASGVIKAEHFLSTDDAEITDDLTVGGNIDLEGDIDVNGTLEADAITVDGVSLSTFIRDTVGTNMVSSNTETGITVTYDTSNDNLDFAINASQTAITTITNDALKIGRDSHNNIDFGTDNEIHFKTNNETPVIKMKASGEIEATTFDGALEGNADTATALATARAINGVDFDGTGAITVTAAGSTLSDTVTVAKGGTNATSFADKSVIITQDSGTDTLAAVAMSTNGQLLIGGTSGPAVAVPTGGDGLTVTVGDGTLEYDLDAALTTVTSLLATDIKIGEDDQTKIDFETADEIHFYAANVHQVKLVDNAFTPQADSDVDLGASGTYWKDAYIDTVTTTGDIDVLGNIELGHASDTTIARASAGQITVEGTAVLLAGAQTGITSLLATDIKIGEDDETKIDFETANEIHFYANNVEQVYLADNIFGPQSDSDVDLGTTGVRWKDAYIDSVTVTGTVTAEQLTSTDDITVAHQIIHSGDTDTGITFATDAIKFTAGGVDMITLTEDSEDTIALGAAISTAVTASIISASTSVETQTLIGNGTDVIFQLGDDSDGSDRSVIFGHSTLKTIMGIDDSADAFVINTDASFDGTLANNSFSIDANHNVIIAGDVSVGDDLSLTSDSSVFNMGAGNDFTITHDGTTGATLAGTPISINSTGDLTLDSTTDIVIDAAGGNVEFKDAGTLQLTLDMDGTGGEQILKLGVDSDDLVFQQYDGTEVLRVGDDATISATKHKFTSASTSAGNHQGDVVYFGNTTSMTTGAIYHYNSSGNWELADADDNTKSDGLLSVALGAASDVNGVLLRGMVCLDHDPGAVGSPIYLTTTAGDASETAPSDNNNIVRVIGYVLGITGGAIWFNPDSTFVQVNA